MRWIGLVVGVAALAFFAVSLSRAWDDAWQVLRANGLAGVSIMLAGLAVIQVTGVVSLRAIGGRPSTRIWATAQLSKYLPVPGAAGFGMVGSTVRHGHTARAAVGFLIRHSLLLIGAALIASTPAVAPFLVARIAVPEALVWTVVIAVGLATAYLSVASYPLRGRLVATLAAVIGWAAACVLIGGGFAGPDVGVVYLGAIFAAGWVAGQIVVPVPAGIGVREAVIIWLAGPDLGYEAALAFALLTRVLHVVIDGLLIAWASVRGRLA